MELVSGAHQIQIPVPSLSQFAEFWNPCPLPSECYLVDGESLHYKRPKDSSTVLDSHNQDNKTLFFLPQ